MYEKMSHFLFPLCCAEYVCDYFLNGNTYARTPSCQAHNSTVSSSSFDYQRQKIFKKNSYYTNRPIIAFDVFRLRRTAVIILESNNKQPGSIYKQYGEKMSNSSSIFRNPPNNPPLQGLVVGREAKINSTKDREAVVTLGGLLLLFILGWVGAALPLVHQAHRSLSSGTPFLYHYDPRRLQSQSSQSDLLQGGAEDRMPYYDDDVIPEGVLSEKRQSFFRAIQEEIDNQDLDTRCQRYGFLQQPANDDLVNPNETQSAVMLEMLQQYASIPISIPKTPRRIFYGSLLADEPHELLEIIAAETYGIFAGMVFVESNRTQTGHKRKITRKPKHIQKFKELFGTPQIQFRRYVNEEDKLLFMAREHRQRQEILKGWREMGMRPDDIGYITDADETFTRYVAPRCTLFLEW